MFSETLDMQVNAAVIFVFDEQPNPEQFLYQGLAINLVIGEGLGLELLRRAVETAVVVGEVQRCDEE
jgi:hypothetical protein